VIITICSSMTLADRIRVVQAELESMGHTVLIPVENEQFDYQEASDHERAELKREHDLIREHWRKIQRSDAILVLNEDVKGIASYVGGNSFLEMGFAHILALPIYMMQPVPEMPYQSEMDAMDPIVIDGDLSRVPLRAEKAPASADPAS
jgi:hypothetical protein